MLTAALRWAPGLLALFILGPIAGAMVGMLQGPDGGPDASLLVNSSPALGLMVLLGVFAITGISSLIASRIVGFRLATWSAGYILAWAAYRATDIPNLLRSQPADAGGPWLMLAVEGLLCGVLAVVLMIGMLIVAKDRPEPDSASPREWLMGLVKSKSDWAGAGAALVAGLMVAFLINMDPTKGQAILAATVAGAAAGAAGAYVGSFVGETPREPIIAIGFCLLAVVGPILGMFFFGSDGLAGANVGSLAGAPAMIGLDWAAGLMMGLPAGVALVESTVEHTTKATA